jgi:transporter family protein
MTMAWLIPSALYVLMVGGLGITGKLALGTLRWPDLVLWTGVGYVVVAAILLVRGQTAIQYTTGTLWAIASGALAIGGLVTLYLALGAGEAGRVTAISAAYPAVTLLLGALFLSEPLTLGRVIGAGLIMAGVVTVSLSS